VTGPAELVVLLDEQGNAVGTADKATVHHRDTPLHLAFSCYLFDDRGQLLLTRRALGKKTWPGAWTNTCCGHPGPDEDLADAVRRRVGQELGLGIEDLRLVLPAFRYRAVMSDGCTENEMCPVYVGRASGDLHADAAEVDDARWVPWTELRTEVLAGTREISPWCREQIAALPEEPWAAPARPGSEMPAAARR
jgi:isopentenyl-diphosphate delta-isomerase